MRNELQIKANGISINYEDSGKNGTPIIFIHGFPFDKSTWEQQFDFLSETHRVIIYDIRGFGKSTSNKKEDVSIDLYADDLIKLMDELKIDKAIVCGLSMGGYITLNAIERYADRFKAIILSDTQCLADTKENKEKRFETIKEIEKNSLKDFADNFIKKLFSEETLQTKKELPEVIKKIILSNSSEAITGALAAMANRKETCTSLSRISVPTLILCGEEDQLTPFKLSEFLFNNIDGSELHIIKKAGHLSNLEQNTIFNEHLRKFLSRITTATSIPL